MKQMWIPCLFFGVSTALFNCEPNKEFTSFDETKKQILKDSSSANQTYPSPKEEPKSADSLFCLFSNKNVKFYLYTRLNQEEPVEICANPLALIVTHFDAKAPIKIICHGFLGQYNEGPGKALTPEYFKHLPPFANLNVIVVDWSKKSGTFENFRTVKDAYNEGYIQSANYVQTVGQLTAEVIDFLVISQGVSLENIHLIGHSLGVHCMGWAGRSVKVGKVSRLTALDAAAPCFEVSERSLCTDLYASVRSSDAQFVDAIHTNVQLKGYERRIGQVDFYANGGLVQPGCGTDPTFGCSHARAFELYAESINPNSCFIGQKCSSWENYNKDICCPWEFSKMGEFCPKTAEGAYFFKTKATSPFAETLTC